VGEENRNVGYGSCGIGNAIGRAVRPQAV
jgi:hypothetical protein